MFKYRILGGIYIKVGQYISTLRGMIPRAWTDTMATLTDNGQCFDYEDIKRMIIADLGKPPEELFASFDKVYMYN